jgi:WD40 repeat protein
MKNKAALTLTFVGITAMTSTTLVVATEPINNSNTNTNTTIMTPKLRSIGSISLGVKSIQGLSYSPNGRYLAIYGDITSDSLPYIIIWDMQRNHQQARINLDAKHIFGHSPLLWAPDGKYLTLGSGLADPKRKLIKEISIDINEPQFNRDGTELLTQWANGQQVLFRVYDSQTWTHQDFALPHFITARSAWTADGRVLSVGSWKVKSIPLGSGGDISEDSFGHTLKSGDVVACITDPTGRQTTQLALLISSVPIVVPNGTPEGFKYNKADFENDFLIINRPDGNQYLINPQTILNINTFKLREFGTLAEILSGNFPALSGSRDFTFSPDGKYLYLKDFKKSGLLTTAKNLILDVKTGQRLLEFKGGESGIAISPDGKRLAIGDGKSIKFYEIQ